MNLDAALTLNLFKRSAFPGLLTQEAYFYDANDLLQYAAVAPSGIATSAAKWVVVQYSYTASNQVSTVKVAPLDSILDNRATLTYA